MNLSKIGAQLLRPQFKHMSVFHNRSNLHLSTPCVAWMSIHSQSIPVTPIRPSCLSSTIFSQSYLGKRFSTATSSEAMPSATNTPTASVSQLSSTKFVEQVLQEDVTPSLPFSSSKPNLIVLGCGWSGFMLLKYIKRQHYNIICVSPRDHFLFTPLLASTTTGTLEFRAIIEGVRTLDNCLYLQAECTNVDPQSNQITCRDHYTKKQFKLNYSYLVISTGMESNTFNTPGIEYAFQLKQIEDARKIRQRILDNFERASSSLTSAADRKQLTNFVIVGGGPTSVEFSGELYDFIKQDVAKWYPAIDATIYLIESSDHLLGSFDQSITKWVNDKFSKREQVKVIYQHRVVEINQNKVILDDKSTIDTNCVVWSTGLRPTKFLKSLNFLKEGRSGRLLTNEWLQVYPPQSERTSLTDRDPKQTSSENSKLDEISAYSNCYALGDCAMPRDQFLPATAQVAQQAAKYLGKRFNKAISDPSVLKSNQNQPAKYEKFAWNNLGMLAYIGDFGGVAEFGGHKNKGFLAWIMWRSAYLTKMVSWKNRLLIVMYWFKSFVFGRDISKF